MVDEGWRHAERQGDLEDGLADLDLGHAFIQEVSAVSPSQLLPSGSVAAADGLADLRIVVVAPEGAVHGAELHLHGADSVSVPFNTDLELTTRIERTQVFLSLSSNLPAMKGRALRWRLLSKEDAIRSQHYGRPYPTDLEDDPALWRSRD